VKTFFDSLALAKRYVDEQGSQAVDDLCMDALHVVCALEWKAQLFVSSDKRQISAAKRAGLHKKHV